MKTKIVDAETLRSLSPSSVTTFLRSRGWALAPTEPERPFRLRKVVAGEAWEVEVPFSSALHGYARRMAEVLDAVEAVEETPQSALVQAIRQAQTDTVRLRVDAEATRGGRIPVEQGAALYTHARDLILAAACAAVEPRAIYASRKPTRATEYLHGLRYGPPEMGSYVLTIESPVSPELQPSLDGIDPEPPFERQVLLTLGRGLQAARRAAGAAAAANDISPFVDAVPEGLTANLCDAVAGLIEPFDRAHLDVSIGFAPSRPVGSGPVRVVFARETAPVLREAARIFKEREPVADFEAEGIVVKLDSPDPSEGGSVVLFCAVDGQPRRVRIALDADGYRLAIRAHQEGLSLALDGELARERGGAVLRGARNIRLRAQ
ncbi:MAG: hypothetical protein H6705_19725 [Myxococcales bacterium]|nr:hypothetical protein [Myxococcales bacterium]